MPEFPPAQGRTRPPARGVLIPVVYVNVPGLRAELEDIAAGHGFILRGRIPDRYDPAVVCVLSSEPADIIAVTSRGMHGVLYQADWFSWHLRASSPEEARIAVAYRLKEWRYKHDGIVVNDSVCGRYRYETVVRWGPGPLMCWLLLNPSASNRPGATRARCAAYAQSWGYAGMVQRNLFAWRATRPSDLRPGTDLQGDNGRYLARLGREDLTVAAWGSSGPKLSRPELPDVPLYCLGVNRDGQPRHPLHAPAGLPLTRYQ